MKKYCINRFDRVDRWVEVQKEFKKMDYKVDAPRLWFGPAARKLETKDIYCDGWIVT